MSNELEFAAVVRFDLYPESVSGRGGQVFSPIRPNHKVKGFEDTFIAQLTFLGATQIEPGESISAEAAGIITKEMLAALKSGTKWLVYTGPRLIGEVNDIEWQVPL
jgi:hypothetical protein